ncbi:hypothetical protein B0J17DRAFT_686936 [Rhizoctonia solani]|nr:hypothetical protein B0J17DRAFT_686936 [Rhizoctonia solani]
MSSPPGTPKQKKGIRRLLKDSFTRSRSRSPSQSQLQPDPGASSTTTRPDEGGSQITSPGRGASRIDSATAITHPPHASPTGSAGLVGCPLSIPVIVEPVDVGPRTTQAAIDQDSSLQIVPTASGTPSNVAAHDLPELSNEASGIPALSESIDTKPSPAPSIKYPERTPSSRGTGDPELIALPTIPPNHGQKRRNVAWDGLRRSLRLLSDSSSVFPQLSSAIEPLLACLEGLELATQNRQDFEELANELSISSESLKQHIDEPSSILLSSSTISVALAIEWQGMMIREGIERMRGGIREACMVEEELVRHYRRIQSYFR